MYSETYIKQCIYANNLQDKWEPQCGDILCYGYENTLSDNFGLYLGHITNEHGQELHYIRDCGGITEGFTGFNKEGYYWIPTQEQLQNQVRLDAPSCKDLSDLNLLSQFRISIQKSCCNSYLGNCTLDEMWLMFYYYAVYKQIWCNQKNRWIRQ